MKFLGFVLTISMLAATSTLFAAEISGSSTERMATIKNIEADAIQSSSSEGQIRAIDVIDREVETHRWFRPDEEPSLEINTIKNIAVGSGNEEVERHALTLLKKKAISQFEVKYMNGIDAVAAIGLKTKYKDNRAFALEILQFAKEYMDNRLNARWKRSAYAEKQMKLFQQQ